MSPIAVLRFNQDAARRGPTTYLRHANDVLVIAPTTNGKHYRDKERKAEQKS